MFFPPLSRSSQACRSFKRAPKPASGIYVIPRDYKALARHFLHLLSPHSLSLSFSLPLEFISTEAIRYLIDGAPGLADALRSRKLSDAKSGPREACPADVRSDGGSERIKHALLAQYPQWRRPFGAGNCRGGPLAAPARKLLDTAESGRALEPAGTRRGR